MKAQQRGTRAGFLFPIDLSNWLLGSYDDPVKEDRIDPRIAIEANAKWRRENPDKPLRVLDESSRFSVLMMQFECSIGGYDDTGEFVIVPTTWELKGWDVPLEVVPFFRDLLIHLPFSGTVIRIN